MGTLFSVFGRGKIYPENFDMARIVAIWYLNSTDFFYVNLFKDVSRFNSYY